MRSLVKSGEESTDASALSASIDLCCSGLMPSSMEPSFSHSLNDQASASVPSETDLHFPIVEDIAFNP